MISTPLMSVAAAPRRALLPGTSRAHAKFTRVDESIPVLSLSGPLAAQEYLQHLLGASSYPLFSSRHTLSAIAFPAEKGVEASVYCELPPSIEAPAWLFENVRLVCSFCCFPFEWVLASAPCVRAPQAVCHGAE